MVDDEEDIQETSESIGFQSSIEFDYNGFKRVFNIHSTGGNGVRVRFKNPIVARMRSDYPHYLRVRIFDIFDGDSWRSSFHEMIKLPVGFDGVELKPTEPSASSELRGYDIFIEHDLGDYIGIQLFVL